MKKLIILLMAICMVITFTAIAFADIEHPTSIMPADIAADVSALVDMGTVHAVGREAPNTTDNFITTETKAKSLDTTMRPFMIEAIEATGIHLNAYMIETALGGTIASYVATSTGKDRWSGVYAFGEPLAA